MGADVDDSGVECYSGYRYAEHPTAFSYQGSRLRVVKILGRWQIPEGLRFLVLGSDEAVYELEYFRLSDHWKVRLL